MRGSQSLFWDANGNLSQMVDCKTGSASINFWDEENRLRLAVNPKFAGYYAYDANGERVYKLTGSTQYDDLNGSNPSFGIIFDGLTVYPSPYIVLTEKQYTKHYYAGTEKIATMIGDGGLLLAANHISKEQRGIIKDNFYRSFEPTTFQYEKTPNIDIQGNYQSQLEYACGYIDQANLSINSFNPMLEPMMQIWQNSNGCTNEIYYTHFNHLGSASWITDVKGNPIQYIHYAPYGELIANQQTIGYDERYKFTGKERDWETGYDYFGARYYWQAGTWLSVDPLASDYPWISPYAYCLWNPVKNIDHDGRFPIVPTILSYYVTAKVLENTPSNSYVRTTGYAMQHPINALVVGPYVDGWSNISSIAGNFEVNLMRAAGISYQKEGDEGNAYRHTLWQAMITNILGEESAVRIGNAHESHSSYKYGKTSGLTESEFDTAIDLRNNEIGRKIGARNKGASNKKLALLVLNEFRKNGLWVGIKQTDGSYSIQKKRITQEQYEAALKELNKKGNNGKNICVE